MLKEALKYLDFFGTEFTFYSDGERKRYTPLGGILTITALILYAFGFILLNLEDLKRSNPFVIKSELPFNNYNQKIKVSNKIWVPWRIFDKNNYKNISELTSFKINYYSSKEKKINQYLYVKNNLCNETSIKENINNISTPLDLLYCTEIDLNSFYDNYIKMDIFLSDNFCGNNQDCNAREEVFKNIKNSSNELKIEIFYPVIKYQPASSKIPVYIEYKRHFYYFNENTYKIDYLFWQEYISNDDSGLLVKNTKNISYWGSNSLNSDYYYVKTEKKLYTLYIYLNPNIIYFQRTYKKLYNVIADSFPLFFVLFLIFEKISKVFKTVEDKKIIFESLFENIVEKPDKFAEFKNKIPNKKLQIEDNQSSSNNNIILSKNPNPNNCCISNINYRNMNNFNVTSNKNNVHKEMYNDILTPMNKRKYLLSNDNLLIITKNKLCYTPNPIACLKSTSFNKFQLDFKQQCIKMIKYKNKILFPYKYYLVSIFCKNMTRTSIEKIKCFNKNFKKFLNINLYIGKFLDITTYVCLHKEIHVLKEKIFNQKNINLLEDSQKININDHISMRNVIKYAGLVNEPSIL